MRIRRNHPAVHGLEADRAGDDDVLAELACQQDTLLVERRLCTRAVGLDGLQHLLGEGEELFVVRDGLGLATDRDHGASLVLISEPVADLAFGRLAVGALGGARHALLAENAHCGLDVAVRLLQRALAVHHRRAGLVAELFDECCRDLSHPCGPPRESAPPSARPPPRRPSRPESRTPAPRTPAPRTPSRWSRAPARSRPESPSAVPRRFRLRSRE